MSDIDSNGASPKVKKIVRRRKKTRDPDSDEEISHEPVTKQEITRELTKQLREVTNSPAIKQDCELTNSPIINLRRSNQLRHVALTNSGLSSSQERLPQQQMLFHSDMQIFLFLLHANRRNNKNDFHQNCCL